LIVPIGNSIDPNLASDGIFNTPTIPTINAAAAIGIIIWAFVAIEYDDNNLFKN